MNKCKYCKRFESRYKCPVPDSAEDDYCSLYIQKNKRIKDVKQNQMEDRTINIIFITKRFCGPERAKKAIAKYMSEECMSPFETYTESILMIILRNAMFDFLNHVSRKQDYIAFIREIVESRHEKMIDKLIVALSFIQVRFAGEYLHGWHETEFTRKVENKEWSVD